MREIVVSLEVNDYWLKEQTGKGIEPFSAIKAILSDKFPDIKVEDARRNRLDIRIYSQSQSSEVRECIKAYMQEQYQMFIKNGDYRLNVKVYYHNDEPETVSDCADAADTVGEVVSEAEEKASGAEDTAVTAESAAAATMAEKAVQEEKADSGNPAGEPICAAQLSKFLKEFDVLIRNAQEYDQEDIIWNTTLLISVDEGYGVTRTLDSIADVLEKNNFTFSSKTTKRVIEYKIPGLDSASDPFWEGVTHDLDSVLRDEKNNGKRSRNAPLIYCFDISEVMSSIDKKDLYERLSCLARSKASCLFVFRIPFVEEIAFKKVAATLEDIYMLRTISIPPYTNSELVEYLKQNLRKRNIGLEGDLDESLERLIVHEKKDGRFWGFRTVKRLVSDIVYQKLLTAQPDAPLIITESDLQNSYAMLHQEEQNPMLELEQLCGMKDVKKTIDEVIAQIKLYNELKKAGKKLDAPCMHMRFVGNPGTGKTTVARLVAQIFKREGILSKGYFYEIKARDLCGRYVGETAPKTSHYCNDALGSVLFIDEAYTLYRGEHNVDYGREALDTLITEMENNRDNLVVIMAGYTREMKDMLEANPGLESRMPYTIEFRNYTREELIDIFYKMLNENFSYTDGFDEAIRRFFNSISEDVLENETFSNARMVRNLYERIWSKAAYRSSVSRSGEIVLGEEDVQQAINDEEFHQLITIQSKKIGF